MGHSIKLLAVVQNVIAMNNLWMALVCNHKEGNWYNVTQTVNRKSLCVQSDQVLMEYRL